MQVNSRKTKRKHFKDSSIYNVFPNFYETVNDFKL